MNKLLNKIVAIGLGMVAAIGVGVVGNNVSEAKAAGEVAVYKTALFGPGYNSGSISSYTTSWSSTNNGFKVDIKNFNNNQNGWNYIKCGSKKSASTGTITTNSTIDKPISKVEVTIDAFTSGKVNSQKLYVSTDKTFDNSDTVITVAIQKGVNVFNIDTPTANLYYHLAWDCAKGSSNGLVTISKINYYSVEIDDNAPTVESVALSNTGYATSFTTDDAWPTTGLDTVVTMSDGSDYEGEVIYTFAPETPALYYSTSATSLSVTAKAQGVSSLPLVIEGITVTPAKGSQWVPYTVSEAYEILSGLDAGKDNGKEVFVTGTVVEDLNYKQDKYGATFTITDGSKSILAYNINGTSITPGATGYVGNGYIVVLGGALKNYNGTYEICQVSNVANSSALSITAPEFGVLSSINVDTLPRTSFETGETFTSEGLILNTVDTIGVELLVNEGFTTDYDGYTFEESDVGTVTVTVSYTLGEVTATTTYDIEVFVPNYTKTTDVITKAFTGNPSSYTDWSNKIGTSGTSYAGNSSGNNSSVQIRSDNSNSGVVSTTSVGKVLKVEIVWHANTSDGRTLNVYGSNTAYSAATDLYNTSKQGKLLGTIVKGTSTTLVLDGTYSYIGLRSNSGAMYLTSISITWAIPKLDEVALNSFAQLILDQTNTICADGGTENNGTELEGAWDAVIDAFEALNNPTKEAFTNAEANTTGTVVEQAAARYDYIVAKYSNCFDVAERNPVSAFNHNIVSPIANVDATTIIAISTLVVLGFASLVIIKRRRALTK